MREKPQVWGLEELRVLNMVELPAWVWSCSTHQVIWANGSAAQRFGRDFAGTTLQSNNPALLLLNQMIKQNVELQGQAQVLSGATHPALPGVMTFPGAAACDFSYKQVILSIPGTSTAVCTLIQLLAPRAWQEDRQHSVAVKTVHRAESGGGQEHGLEPRPSTRPPGLAPSALACTTSSMLEMVDNILAGQPVEVEGVEALRTLLLKGQVVVQSPHLGEEMVVAEALDQDVGLNLLQLLGSRHTPAAPSFTAASINIVKRVQSQALLHSSSLARGGGSASSAWGLGEELKASSLGGRPGLIGEGGEGEEGEGGGEALPSHACSQPVSSSSLVVGEEGLGGSFTGEGGRGVGEYLMVASSLVPAMEQALVMVDEWRFDAFKLYDATQGHPMSALGFWLLQRAGMVSDGSPSSPGLLDGPRLARFLRKVEDGYAAHPYHCATHAADVLQSMHVLLTRGGLVRKLGEELGLLAAYLAAMVHDVDHRGVNNDFLMRTSDDLALTYNDNSPAENHHAAVTFRLLRLPHYNFLAKLPCDKMARLRRLLIEMVLATDMKLHFSILSRFQCKLQVKLRSSSWRDSAGMPLEPSLLAVGGMGSGGSSNGHASGNGSGGSEHGSSPLLEDEADRSLVLQLALKCADVGHLATPWEVHHRWVCRLEEEFWRQGDRERKAGLVVSPLMDRSKDGITKSQVGFFDIVALPLFYTWAAVFPEALPLVRAVEDNCNRWRLLEAGRKGKQG